jgi:hypothetical protein
MKGCCLMSKFNVLIFGPVNRSLSGPSISQNPSLHFPDHLIRVIRECPLSVLKKQPSIRRGSSPSSNPTYPSDNSSIGGSFKPRRSPPIEYLSHLQIRTSIPYSILLLWIHTSHLLVSYSELR